MTRRVNTLVYPYAAPRGRIIDNTGGGNIRRRNNHESRNRLTSGC